MKNIKEIPIAYQTKNINIKIPAPLLNRLKILAIEKNKYLKDYIISILQREIDNANSNNTTISN